MASLHDHRLPALVWIDDVWLTGWLSQDRCRAQAYLQPAWCRGDDARLPSVWIEIGEIAARLDLWPTSAAEDAA